MLDLEKLKVEEEELIERIEKLIKFMESEEFKEISPLDQDLLRSQERSMEAYALALRMRIGIHEPVPNETGV